MAATKENWEAYRAELLTHLEEERQFIGSAEAGRVGLWRIDPEKGKVDTTAAHVELAKRAVAALEGVIAKIDIDHLKPH